MKGFLLWPVVARLGRRSRLAKVLIGVGGVAASLALFQNAKAATTEAPFVPRSGDYDLYRGGARVGTESYQWAIGDSGTVTLSAQCVLELDGLSTTLRPALNLDTGTLTPLSYQIERLQEGNAKRVNIAFAGGKAVQETEENGTSSRRQMKIKPADLVVNDQVLCQFLIVAERYDFEAGGSQDFTVFDANSGRNYVAHAMVRGLGTIQNAQGKFRTRRLTLNLEEVAVDLYVDSRGQVPLISIPLKGIEARMPTYEGEEKAARLAPSRPLLGSAAPGR